MDPSLLIIPYLALPLSLIKLDVHPCYGKAAVPLISLHREGILARKQSYWLPILLPPALPHHVLHHAGHGCVQVRRDNNRGGFCDESLQGMNSSKKKDIKKDSKTSNANLGNSAES